MRRPNWFWQMVWGRVILFLSLALPFGYAVCVEAATPPSDSLARLALVIGNSGYRALPLDNPLNDARAMAATLEKLGFRVIKVENASQSGMYEAIRTFGDALKAAGGIGLFYYAGHGVQIKGRNYLLPVDTTIQHEDEVAYKAVDAGQVLEKMETAKNPLNIVILDACRDNPFSRSSRSATVGLAPMEAPAGSIVAFATAPGAAASDGHGKHGLYTEQLLNYMTQPGLKAEDVFKRVRVAVRQQTRGSQIPWENTSLEGDFYFVPPAPGTAGSSGTTPDPLAVELEYWQAIKASNNPRDYQAYLERFPNGQFAPIARNRALGAGNMPKTDAAPLQTAAVEPSRSPSGFSFSAEEEKMRASTERSSFPPNIPCARSPHNARVRVDIAEQQFQRAGAASPQSHGILARAITQRLQQAGMKIASAGNTDYLLRGTVTTQASANRYLVLNEISVNAALTMTTASGQVVSSVLSREESYAGNDLHRVYLDLVEQQAHSVASQLYTDLCNRK